jgi:hypothetical protein
LKAARQSFKEQFRLYTGVDEVPGSGGYLSFEKPILVRVTGWAFYDSDHPVNPSTGTVPVGPPGHKPGSTWEVHPVMSFEFDPHGEVSPFALAVPGSNAPHCQLRPGPLRPGLLCRGDRLRPGATPEQSVSQCLYRRARRCGTLVEGNEKFQTGGVGFGQRPSLIHSVEDQRRREAISHPRSGS